MGITKTPEIISGVLSYFVIRGIRFIFAATYIIRSPEGFMSM